MRKRDCMSFKMKRFFIFKERKEDEWIYDEMKEKAQ